ncbi:MAG: thioredoxin fold domain-containing protein [Chitinophagales bacterium]|nr:thioredoxin fold domain-containing protein [Chitinophagales bacterium]
MYKFLFFSACLMIFNSCSSQESELDANQYYKKIASEKIKNLIDVRTPEEYSEGYIEGAININWNAENFEAELDKLDRNTPLFLYCLSGGRSGNAMRKAKEMGFKKIYGLSGGIMAWRTSKLPLSSPKGEKKSGMSMADYEALYKGKTKKILIDFYAEWCIPCQKMKPFLKKIESKLASDVTVIRINADDNPELCQSLGVSGLPYIFIYKNDRVVWKKLGYASEEEILKELNK